MGGLRVSALLLGLLCLIPGAVRPEEETSGPPADPRVAPTILLLVSSSEFPDVSVSSGAPGPPDVTSEAPDNEVPARTERPPPSPTTTSSPKPNDAVSNVTTAAGDITGASNETTPDPNRTSPVTDSNNPTSADVTEPAPPTPPPSAANNVTTVDTATETPSLLATIRTTAKTHLSDDSTTHTTPPEPVHSTLMSAITTSLSITTVTSEVSSAAAMTSNTAKPHTTRAEVQQGPSVLEVGDDKDPSYHSRNSSNPLFVMIISVFTIMVVMVVVVVGFHRYKKRNSRTEFRRLQDLPMDDMMEDTPLSLYSY